MQRNFQRVSGLPGRRYGGFMHRRKPDDGSFH